MKPAKNNPTTAQLADHNPSGLTSGGQATSAPGGRPTRRRRSWHRTAGMPVRIWLLLLPVAALLHAYLPYSRWIAVHIITVGLITSSILVWSQHFSEALLRVPITTTMRRLQITRVFAVSAGLLLLIVGMVRSSTLAEAPASLSALASVVLVLTGATLVAGAAAWHACALWRQRRLALSARFGVVVNYYISASLFLPLGALIGVLTVLFRPVTVPMLPMHIAANVYGFAGLSIIGTLLTLWPTIVRTRIHPHATRLATWTLPVFILTIIGFITAVWLSLTPLASICIVVHFSVLLGHGWIWLRTAWRGHFRGYAAVSVGAALAWLLIAAGIMVLLVLTGRTSFYLPLLTPVLALGFLLQLLIAVMSYLLPVTMGGGPRVVKLSSAVFNRWWLTRISSINVGVVLIALPQPLLGEPVHLLGWLLLILGFASFVPLMVLAVRARVAAMSQ